MFIWIGIDVDNQLASIKEKSLTIDKELAFEHSCFTLPMHISLKMSFEVKENNFGDIINTISEYYYSLKPFDIEIDTLEKDECIAWIRMKNNEILNRISYDLNCILMDKYNIGLHEYDLDYKFHITLFMDDDTSKVNKAFEQIKDLDFPQSLVAHKFVIGTSECGNLGTYSIYNAIDLVKKNENKL